MELLKPQGRFCVLIRSMGAAVSQFIAGVETIKQGIAKPIGI